MLGTELGLFIVLMTTCNLGVDADHTTVHSVTCEGSTSEIFCDKGVVIVQTASYGRNDEAFCSADMPAHVVNNQCVLPVTSTIADRCNGKALCEVTVSSKLFLDDPCPGIYKYLDVTYTCATARTSVTCEDGHSELDCGIGIISVLHANYGRRDKMTCSDGQPTKALANVNCFLSVTDHVSRGCNGKTHCQVSAANAAFSDPCRYTYKYLEVVYRCLNGRRSVTCENDPADFSCAGGAIRIYDAEYGRTDSTTCIAGRPRNQIGNTNCALSVTDALSNRCNGKTSCKVMASNNIFTDPCVGTYKYLVASYGCEMD